MHRIDGPGATVDNKFTEGDPVGGVEATVLTAAWANDIQEELMSILAAAGIAPVKGTQNQVVTAIQQLTIALLASAAEAQGLASNSKLLSPGRLSDAFKGSNQSLSVNGYQKFPGGMIVQWGTVSGASSTVTFPIAFTSSVRAVVMTPRLAVSYTVSADAVTLGSFLTRIYNSTTAAGVSADINWMAIGY